MSAAANYWSYTGSGGNQTHSMSSLEAALIVLACVAFELIVVVAASWSDRRSRHGTTARARRVRRRHVRIFFRTPAAIALDQALENQWAAGLDACRREAAYDIARLVSRRVPINGVRTIHPHRHDQSIHLTFADGTALALWPNDRANARRARQLRTGAVLLWASSTNCGSIRFGTKDEDMFIDGELLLATPRWTPRSKQKGEER